MASSSNAYVYRPSTLKDLRGILDLAGKNGRTIAFRGGGNSYGDAFGNREEIVLDLSRLNRILEWDPTAGIIRVEPGVTIDQLWRFVLPDGWWPPVVTGTALTTVGGCAGMNTHGKNGWKLGTFGDHVLEFDLMKADGEMVTACPETDPELFYAAIGGFGMLGVFTSLTIQLKRIYSGLLRVEGASCPHLGRALDYLEEHLDDSDYLVGWLDGYARGRSLGRGEMHRAVYLAPGEDPSPQKTLQVPYQELPDSYFGLLPKSSLWFYMRFFLNPIGGRLTNTLKYTAARLLSGEKGRPYTQSHVAFHFLLDYVPGWKRAYLPGGLIQYQSFLPKERAEAGYREILELCQRRGLVNYLSVLKRHVPDKYLISYGVDGYSLAMDFKVTRRGRPDLVRLTRELDEIVLRHDGRFYLAKDSVLRPEVARRYLGEETIARFKALKAVYDPAARFQSDLWRRVFS